MFELSRQPIATEDTETKLAQLLKQFVPEIINLDSWNAGSFKHENKAKEIVKQISW